MSNINKLIISRKINAPIEKVYDAFTQNSILKKWFAPEEMTTPTVDIDLKVGGEYKICMQDKSGKNYCAVGEFKELDKPNRIRYTWSWEEEDTEQTEVLVELNELDKNTTEVRFTHSGFTSEESTKNHEDGWQSAFNKLKTYFKD